MIRHLANRERATDADPRPGCFGYERCVELSRLHSSSLVEPHSRWGMGNDGAYRDLLQSAVWLSWASVGIIASHLANNRINGVLIDSGYRQSAGGIHRSVSAESAPAQGIPKTAIGLRRRGQKGSPDSDTCRYCRIRRRLASVVQRSRLGKRTFAAQFLRLAKCQTGRDAFSELVRALSRARPKARAR